jgi:broad specificity phosphatase PhoE
MIGDNNNVHCLILLRHGETDLNRANLISNETEFVTGQYDVPLNDTGRRQAIEAGDALASRPGIYITSAFTSDLSRALETTRLVLSRLPQAVPLNLEPTLRERFLGAFEGQRISELRVRYPSYFTEPGLLRWMADFRQSAPGGENFTDVTERVRPVIGRIVTDRGGDTLVVSHIRTISCILGMLLHLPEETVLRLSIPNAVPIFVTKQPTPRIVGQLTIDGLVS